AQPRNQKKSVFVGGTQSSLRTCEGTCGSCARRPTSGTLARTDQDTSATVAPHSRYPSNSEAEDRESAANVCRAEAPSVRPPKRGRPIGVPLPMGLLAWSGRLNSNQRLLPPKVF